MAELKPKGSAPAEGMSAKPGRKEKRSPKRTSTAKQTCGIIMPLSAIDGCLEQHWLEVREILEAAVAEAGFEARLVSDAEDVGII